MSTQILITPPGGVQQEIKAFDNCKTTLSTSDKAGSFNLSLPSFSSDILDAFPVGSDVQITQNDSIFRGWVVKPPKALNGLRRTVNLEGSTYTAKTQKIIVAESYTNTAMSDIVTDLFTKYAPWATRNNIQACSKVITIRFSDAYLWDAMTQLCTISSYDWYVDENLDVNFFGNAERYSTNVIGENDYRKGTANFTPDASKLVNKLYVKGGKALSDPFIQNITIGTIPIPLLYSPRDDEDGTGVAVLIGGSAKTVGIQNVTAAGTKDFLLNVSEKLLVPDLCTSGSGTITYSYQYPIKIIIEDKASQTKYGIFEDILKVDSKDKTLVIEQGLQYIAKYSSPVVIGNIEPFEGAYTPGELVKVNIPDLNINDYFQVNEFTCETIKGLGTIHRSLQLESPERTVRTILKDMNSRLSKLESSVYNDSEGSVEKLLVFTDAVNVPTITDSMTFNLHQYKICGQFVCGTGVI